MNKTKGKKRVPIILLAIVLAIISTAFFINQESRDFKLGKSLDIFFSLVRELNTFYVDEFDPERLSGQQLTECLKF